MSAPSRRSSKKVALQARDDGLRKIAIATRVLVAGSIAATGVFTAMAASAQPGRAKGTSAASGSTPYANVGGVDGSASANNANLSPPTTLPDPGYQYSSPAIVSGAS